MNIEQAGCLEGYLRAKRHVPAGLGCRVGVLASGVSNRTVLVELANGQSWVVKQALAKLRVKADWFSNPARIHREALGLRLMNQVAPDAAPRVVFEDPTYYLLAMEAVPQPHDNLKTLLLQGQLPNDRLCGYVRALGQLLGTLHRHTAENCQPLPPAISLRPIAKPCRPRLGRTTSRCAGCGTRWAACWRGSSGVRPWST